MVILFAALGMFQKRQSEGILMNKVSLLVSSTEQVQWFSPAVKYKKLQDVLAVQALSRLNRSCEKYGKKTEDLFILDFF